MKGILAALLLALLLPSYAAASIQPQDEGMKGHLIAYGIVTISDQQQKYEITGQQGRYILSKVLITKKTDVIPLKIGTAFGIVWAISGIKEGAIEVTYTVEHPEMTLENGQKRSIMTETIKQRVIDGVAGSADGFDFAHDYELVPGEWKISIKYKDVEISKTFTVR